jgi:hypothetical protein
VEAGPAVQEAPADMPQPVRAATPIMPPLAAPQPNWKQELKQETAEPPVAGAEPGGDSQN